MNKNKKLSDLIEQQDFASLYPSKPERILETIKSNLENEYELLELKNLLDEECRKIFNIDFYRNLIIELIGIDKMIPLNHENDTFKVYIEKDNYVFMKIDLNQNVEMGIKKEDITISLHEDEWEPYRIGTYTTYTYNIIDKDSPKMLSDLIKSLNIIGK